MPLDMLGVGLPHYRRVVGIYAIRNLVNCKVYVGSSVRVPTRLRSHLLNLRRGSHTNPHLQAAWDKYGEGSFITNLVELCSESDLLAREDYWIDTFGSLSPEFGYNTKPAARPVLSDEVRCKISNSRTGKSLTVDEWREVPRKTAVSPEESKRAAAERLRGNTLCVGRRFSDESLAKMSESHRGKPNGWSGRRHSPETRAKMAASRRNRIAIMSLPLFRAAYPDAVGIPKA